MTEELPSNHFELELEFVQSLASPAYLHFPATSENLSEFIPVLREIPSAGLRTLFVVSALSLLSISAHRSTECLEGMDSGQISDLLSPISSLAASSRHVLQRRQPTTNGAATKDGAIRDPPANNEAM